LLGVAAHIGEGHDRDRRLVGQRQCGCRNRWLLGRSRGADAVDAHWPDKVLYVLLAHIFESEIQLVAHLITHYSADTNPARLRERLQTRRDVHPIAKDVVLLNDYVAEVDADPKLDPLGGRDGAQ
jgi:hypothetical protein